MQYTALMAMTLVFIAASFPSFADELVAYKPGVMCKSAKALEKLTLHGGDSRTHAHPVRGEDLAVASEGGCIDIPAGAKVFVQQGFKNTSIVLYPLGSGDIYTIPNIDFVHADRGVRSTLPPAGSMVANHGRVPPGYRLAEQLPAGAPGQETFVILEDSQITPALRKRMWNQFDDPTILLAEGVSRTREFARHPFQNAHVLLIGASGQLVAEKTLTGPLAEIKPAPLQGAPAPAFFLTVSHRTEVGGSAELATTILVPSTTKLEPIHYLSDREHRSVEITLPSTLR